MQVWSIGTTMFKMFLFFTFLMQTSTSALTRSEAEASPSQNLHKTLEMENMPLDREVGFSHFTWH